MSDAAAGISVAPPTNSGRRSGSRIVRFIVLWAILLCGPLGFMGWRHYRETPRRFAEVVPGQLYRSGSVTPNQLASLKSKFGVGRIISFLDPNVAESVNECAEAEKLGIRWENVPMRGNGESTPADRAKILELLNQADAAPTLVHCSAGTNRTGLAVGLYRIYHQGWSYDDVCAEMKKYDFEDLDKHENLRAALREAEQSARAAKSASQPGPRP